MNKLAYQGVQNSPFRKNSPEPVTFPPLRASTCLVLRRRPGLSDVLVSADLSVVGIALYVTMYARCASVCVVFATTFCARCRRPLVTFSVPPSRATTVVPL